MGHLARAFCSYRRLVFVIVTARVGTRARMLPFWLRGITDVLNLLNLNSLEKIENGRLIAEIFSTCQKCQCFLFFYLFIWKEENFKKKTSKQTARLVSSGKPRCPFYLFIYWFSSFTAVCSASYPHDLWPPSENKVSLPADGRFFVLRDFLLLLVCSFLLFAFFFVCWFVFLYFSSLLVCL